MICDINGKSTLEVKQKKKKAIEGILKGAVRNCLLEHLKEGSKLTEI
jgi:hypothetical protein